MGRDIGFLLFVVGWFVALILVTVLFSAFWNWLSESREQKRKQEQERWLQTSAGQKSLREATEKQRELETRQKEEEEEIARREWNCFHEKKDMAEISGMTGLEFEQFLARLLSRMGYSDILLTPVNDQGGDIVCRSPSGLRLVVQAKRWKGTVGNGAVQEVLGALLHYRCKAGMIITNSVFTQAARVLARKGNITLYDGEWLQQRIREFFPATIPPFDWQEYNSKVKPANLTLTPKRGQRGYRGRRPR